MSWIRVGKSLVVALVAVTSVLAAAGCGRDDDSRRPSETEDVRLTKQEYVQRARTIQLRAYRELAPVFSELVGERLSHDRCSRRAQFFHSRIERALDRVAALEPPEEVAELQDRFLAAANRSANQIGEVVEEVRRGRLSCGRALNDRIYGLPSTEQAQRVLREFDQRGYDFVYE